LRDRWAAETWEAIEASKAQAAAAQGATGGKSSAAPNPAPFVEAIRSEHIEGDWGFVVFRTTYGNDSQWAQFRERWDQVIEGQLDHEHGDGIADVRDRLRFQWVEDQARLADAGHDEVRRSVYACNVLKGQAC
jgi:hypothetical protein